MDIPAGVYFVRVRSQGAYDDVGQYTVNVLDGNGPRIDAASIASVGASTTSVWSRLTLPFHETHLDARASLRMSPRNVRSTSDGQASVTS